MTIFQQVVNLTQSLKCCLNRVSTLYPKNPLQPTFSHILKLLVFSATLQSFSLIVINNFHFQNTVTNHNMKKDYSLVSVNLQ